VGCTVDKDGCPIDSDKDGVIDCRDKCPNTPEGCAVNKDGCPLDSDNDGVIDCRDKCPNTPAGAKVDKDGCSREKISISLNVQFDTAKADIKGKYHNNIKRVADFMKMYPNTSAIIEGHTDTVGKEAYNIRLSKARADSVKQYLVDKFGIDASSIETIGYGPKKPVADNSTPEGKQKNRRVDAVLETMLVR
jgi:OOP family OmpA-OmpF porin